MDNMQMTDSQLLTHIYATTKSLQTSLLDFKEQVKKDNLDMHNDIDKINARLDGFEHRLDKLERKPGEKAELIINTIFKAAGLGILAYLGKFLITQIHIGG